MFASFVAFGARRREAPFTHGRVRCWPCLGITPFSYRSPYHSSSPPYDVARSYIPWSEAHLRKHLAERGVNRTDDLRRHTLPSVRVRLPYPGDDEAELENGRPIWADQRGFLIH